MSKTEIRQALGTGVVIEAVESMTGAESIAPDHMGRGARPSTQYVPDVAPASEGLQREVEVLLYRQAALLDAKRWQDWTELFTDDGVYWMPVTPEQTDWLGEPSIFAEDRLLMEVRMGRLLHPNAWSQAPMWGTNHLVGNVIVEAVGGDTVRVYSRFQMMELRRDAVRHFGGSYRHTLVRTPQGLRIRLQRVDLMNGQAAFDYVIQAWV
jgi:3-phenylpropionate/cinnamic acid dioxygenase small subunit